MTTEPRVLVEKLNPICRQALAEAAELCVKRTHYVVEAEHLLVRLLEDPRSDLVALLRHYDVADAGCLAELTRELDRLERGNRSTPSLSPPMLRWLERAWLVSSLRLGEAQVRSGALLLALLDDEFLRGRMAERSAPTLLRVPREPLRDHLPELVRGLAEDGAGTPAPRPAGPGAASASPATAPASAPGGESALERFTVDLTAQARAGRLDPIHGRDAEIRQIVDILMRRRQNNPILTGEAGVGKTAVVEGFARRLAEGAVPPPLRDARVLALDLGLLQAGAGVRGEFEGRLRQVIDEVKASPRAVILFIDEAHTLIGAGAAEGRGDAANLLKPALARGELRTIAATTWAEYKKYVERDSALARRFQVIRVEEPDEDAACEMLRGIVARLEGHHGVRVLEEGVRDAVRLSHRYLPGRQLPDKAVSVLDTACARVAVGQGSVPAAVEDAARRVEALELEREILEREQDEGAGHAARLAELEAAADRARADRAAVEDRWRAERERVDEALRVRAALADDTAPADAHPRLRRALAAAERELDALQGDDPLVPLSVSSRVVAQVVSSWTGIPLSRIIRDDVRAALALRGRLADRIVGQPEALEAVSRRVRTFQASLENPRRPVGAFLLVGPSGVGKTETARALAAYLYGGERSLVAINLGEYQEAHSVSGLRGAPPGYVGFGTGGALTEAVRRRPYSVVLLDEAEKAHPDVLELFYSVLDQGSMEDAEGTPVDFRNTVVLMTSNVGAETILELCRDGRRPAPAEVLEAVRPELLRAFRPALLARLTPVPYFPLGDAEIREVVELRLAEVQRRFWEGHGAELTYDEAVPQAIAARCTEVDSGARNVDHILSHAVLPDLAARVLERMARGERFAAARLVLDEAGEVACEFDDAAPATAAGGAGPWR
jgi:type VI secretion system protein VasG